MVGSILLESSPKIFQTMDPTSARYVENCINKRARTGHSFLETIVYDSTSEYKGTTRHTWSAHQDAPPFAELVIGYYGLSENGAAGAASTDDIFPVAAKWDKLDEDKRAVPRTLKDTFADIDKGEPGPHLPGIRFRMFKNPERKSQEVPDKKEIEFGSEVTFEFRLDTDGNMSIRSEGWFSFESDKTIYWNVMGNIKMVAQNIWSIARDLVQSRKA